MATAESVARDKQIAVDPAYHRRVRHADTWSKRAKAGFLPHVPLPTTAMYAFTAIQVAAALIFWFFIPESVFPGPLKIAQALGRLWFDQALGREIFTSLALNVEMIVLLIPIGFVAVVMRSLGSTKGVVTAASTFRFLGMTGLTLIFTVYTASGHSLKLSILVFFVGAYLITSIARIVDAVTQEERDYVRTLGMTEWEAMYEVDLRGRLVELYEALRQNQAMGWMMLTAVEGIAKAEGGVGTLLLSSQRTWALDEVYAIQIALWIIGLVIDQVLIYGRRQIPWADLRVGRKS